MKKVNNSSPSITEISARETYPLRHHVMWPNQPMEYVMLDEDETGIHYGLWKHSTLVSVVSVFIKNDSCQFRKLATAIKEQGQGFGTQLLKHVMKVAKQKNIKTIWCNARADKTRFYEKFGMHRTSKTFTKGGIPYRVMTKDLKLD